MTSVRIALIAVPLLIALNGCSHRDEQTDVLVNDTEISAEPVNATEPPPPPPPANSTTEKAPTTGALDAPSEAQVQEDAEATGMTSRLPDREESAPASSNAAVQ